MIIMIGKIILTSVLTFIVGYSWSQTIYPLVEDDDECTTQYLDSATVVNLPWFGNNQFLSDFLITHGYFDGNPQARTTNCPEKFLLPVNIFAYRDNENTPASSLSVSEIEDIILQTNELFTTTNSRIRIFIKNIYFEANENYRTGLQSPLQSATLFAAKGLTYGNTQYNIHIIRGYGTGHTARGFGTLPMYPNIPGAYKSCWIKTHDFTGSRNSNAQLANTLIHELGHNLGLLHTHNPGRIFTALGNNKFNAQISNGCYQESVSRSKRNYWYDGCVSTNNMLKSEVNGDFLSDTAADPGISKGGETSGIPTCSYLWNGDDTDFNEDNWGDTWDPPTRNIMSYATSFECRNQFSTNQIGVLWYYAQEHFNSYPASQQIINGGNSVSCSPLPFSTPTGFTNVTSYTWSHTSNITILSGQGTGTISTLASSSGSGKLFLDIVTPYGSFCLEKAVSVNATLPAAPYPLTYNSSDCPEILFTAAYTPGLYYTWQYYKLPNGPVTYMPNSLDTKRINFYQNGWYAVGVQMVNSCGAGSVAWVDINITCGGGSGGHRFAYYPNPATERANR
ncbi:MAG: hypothetical protein KF763_10450 [Cyclobacteriaceae bacterium]|nr:hypothetical protein [Cyclobacteriaceae bacterium]